MCLSALLLKNIALDKQSVVRNGKNKFAQLNDCTYICSQTAAQWEFEETYFRQ